LYIKIEESLINKSLTGVFNIGLQFGKAQEKQKIKPNKEIILNI
jgi:hypothetical protein